MFYHRKTNQYINEGQPFQIDDTSYPSNWLNGLSLEEKIAFGLEEVTNSNEREDDRFYWVSENLNGNVRSYVNTPKDLDMLKKEWINQIQQAAYSTLLPSDWMIVKAMETQTAIPDAWKTYRTEVRLVCNNAVESINSASNVPALQNAIKIEWPKSPDLKENK